MTYTESSPSVWDTAEPRGFSAVDLAYVAIFAALLAALSLMPAIPVGALGVPITLQTLGVSLVALCLGPLRGAAAVALYVAVGAAGLPVFAQGKAGLGVLAGATGGYLISFILCAFVVGLLTRVIIQRGLNQVTPLLLLLVLIITRLVIILPIGMAGMMRAAGISAKDAFMVDILYWVGDLIKSVVAVFLAIAVHKAFPRLLGRR